MRSELADLVERGTADLEAFWDLLDDYVVWDLRASPLLDLEPVYVGRDAVMQASRHYFGTWDDYALRVQEMVEAGSSVMFVVHETGRGKGSGAPFERHFAQVWTFRGDRLVRWDVFPDREGALAALALGESGDR
jgi:ketosteroid isomerase-like protein